MRFRRRFVILATIALLAVSSCRRAKTLASLPDLGAEPAWTVTDLAGKPVGAETLRGKVVVVDFWATWCGPCLEEMPGYVDLQKKYGPAGLVIVGLSVDEGGAAPVREFAAKNGITYRLAMADEKLVAQFGSMEGFPTTFLIDRQGRVRHRKIGIMPEAGYEQLIRSLL
ncbi:MAG TPA: TlpA disulfide reductase family protein [Candidatus Didemnitutus sp.]